jgi:Spy/CpxP family protein refolding chaperone
MKTKLIIITSFVLMIALGGLSSNCPAQQTLQKDSSQSTGNEDPIGQLNLSPEQREQIRTIRQQMQAERVQVNERLREANRLFEQVLESDNPDETVVEERVKELATAQAAQLRMRALLEVRIRRVLTPDQRVLLQNLRQQAKQMRQQRNAQGQQGQAFDQQRLQNRRELRQVAPTGNVRPNKNRR